MNPKDAIGRAKPSISFTPSRSILEMGRAMEHGAGKYGAFNWRTDRISATVYLNATFRHLVELLEGVDTDADSGLPHAAHIMACMAILLDGQQQGTLDDDRLGKQTAERPAPDTTFRTLSSDEFEEFMREEALRRSKPPEPTWGPRAVPDFRDLADDDEFRAFLQEERA